MTKRFKLICGDAMGGAVGALISVPIILSCGVVSYQSLGHDFITTGISAAFVAAFIATAVPGLLGGTTLHISSPKTTHAAILSGLIAIIGRHSWFTHLYHGANATAALIAICLLALLISGLTQLLLGASRMGALVKFIPYPVLAGLINGFALQIILNQLPKLVGSDRESQLLDVLSGSTPVNLWCVGLSALAGGSVWMMKGRSPWIPGPLVGLVGGTLTQHLLGHYVDASALGPKIGALPAGLTFALHVDDIWQAASTLALSHHMFPVLVSGITLAFVSSIQSLLSISAADRLLGTRHNSNHELLVQGASNLLSALLGGAPSGGSPNITQSVFASGGRTRFANLFCAATLLSLSYGLSEFIAQIPLSVMAGVVIVTTAGSMDKWTRDLISKIGVSGQVSSRSDVLLNLIVVILVAALVVSLGALAALGIGIASVFMVFLHRSNAAMIRRILPATHRRSRTERPHAALDALAAQGHRIVLIELDGPLFFGSAETVARSIDSALSYADWVVLDLKRVSHFDSSGVMMLKRVDESMAKVNKTLFLAQLPVDGNRRRFLRDIGLIKPEKEGRVFEHTDTALARAEDQLLRMLDLHDNCAEEIALDTFDAVRGMSSDEIGVLRRLATRQSRNAGDVLVSADATPSGLLFLLRGKVAEHVRGDRQALRLARYRPGMVLGEMASSDAMPKAYSLVADTEVVLLELAADALACLREMHPRIEANLMRNIAIEFGFRLRNLNEMLVELDM